MNNAVATALLYLSKLASRGHYFGMVIIVIINYPVLYAASLLLFCWFVAFSFVVSSYYHSLAYWLYIAMKTEILSAILFSNIILCIPLGYLLHEI